MSTEESTTIPAVPPWIDLSNFTSTEKLEEAMAMVKRLETLKSELEEVAKEAFEMLVDRERWSLEAMAHVSDDIGKLRGEQRNSIYDGLYDLVSTYTGSWALHGVMYDLAGLFDPEDAEMRAQFELLRAHGMTDEEIKGGMIAAVSSTYRAVETEAITGP